MNIPEEVNYILHEHFEIALDRLEPETDLYQDLDLDSLDGADLLVLLEARVGQTIMPEAFLRTRTLQDVYDVVAELDDSSNSKTYVNRNNAIGTQPPASETTVVDDR